MEASALNHTGLAGLRGPTPLLRLQSDERLVALTRRGNQAAYEALVARYQARLLAFCRHMLSSREDAEDVLQEVFAAAFNAMMADERPLNVRPWLYRIARNRSLNHLRRATAVGVDSMDVHFADGGMTTADKVHRREEFRHLVADVQELPETQRTALLLREIDALSYEQIAEAMETTVPSVKSLLVRARVSLAEASEARKLTCEEVRAELGEVAEGLRRTSAPVRRHVRQCERCAFFRRQLRDTNKALAAVYPVAPLLFLKKVVLAHLGTTAGAGGGAAAAGTTAAAAGGAGASSIVSAGVGAIATKTAATIAAAAIVTAGAVEVDHATTAPAHHRHHVTEQIAAAPAPAPVPVIVAAQPQPTTTVRLKPHVAPKPKPAAPADKAATGPAAATAPATTTTTPAVSPAPQPLPEQGYDSTQLPPQQAGSMGANGGVAAPEESSTTTTSGSNTTTTSTPQPAPQPAPTGGSTTTTTTTQPAPQPSPSDGSSTTTSTGDPSQQQPSSSSDGGTSTTSTTPSQ